jgi:NAD(P)-dependent dehydrogenase (short-subunit alcohol dehydrogenase family)
MSTVVDRFRLDGKVAIVTGASSDLGVAIALAVAQAGADVALAARRAERIEHTRQLIAATGRRALAVPADLSDPEQAATLVQAALAEFGRVDVLVNNDGKGSAIPSTRETPQQFPRTSIHRQRSRR